MTKSSVIFAVIITIDLAGHCKISYKTVSKKVFEKKAVVNCDYIPKQDQIWSKAASQDQLPTKLNFFKSKQMISNPSDFKSK